MNGLGIPISFGNVSKQSFPLNISKLKSFEILNFNAMNVISRMTSISIVPSPGPKELKM